MARRLAARWAVLFLAALAVTTACTAPGPTPTTQATNGTRSGTGTSSTSATSGTTTPEPPPTTPGGLEYVPWGPEDPPIPQEYADLAASAGHPPRCSDLEAAMPSDSPFWQVALGVCQALFEGGSWPDATTVPPAPTAESPFQACLDRELTAFLEDALAWHAAHPGELPETSLPGPTRLSPCQVSIFEVDVLDAGHYDLEGAPPVGVPLAVFFSDAGTGAASVSVDGEPVPDVTGDFWADGPEGVGMAKVVVLVPPREEAGPARVEVRTTRGLMSTTVDLPAGSTSGTASDGPEPSPSGGDPTNPSPSPDASPGTSGAPGGGESSP